LLYGRSSHSFLGAAPNAASHLLSSGFLNFADLLIHVSSINPAQVFPLVGLNASVWLLLAGLVLVYFGLSFLFRRRLQDGFLLIIFISFSVFFVAYPSRQSYFALYPLMAFVVMFGGFVSRAFNSMLRTRKPLLRVICIIILGLYVTAQANNIAAASATYSSGFGDWDEMKSIMSYINRNHEPGAFVVTPNDLTFYYASKYGIDVQVVPMVEPAPYYSEPPNQKILDAPLKPGLGYRPIIWVISASTIESLNPHFIVISRDNYERTDSAFRQFVNERYRQPLSTTFILLFEMRGPP